MAHNAHVWRLLALLMHAAVVQALADRLNTNTKHVPVTRTTPNMLSVTKNSNRSVCIANFMTLLKQLLKKVLLSQSSFEVSNSSSKIVLYRFIILIQVTYHGCSS